MAADHRLGVASAVFGAALWLFSPLVPGGAAPAFGSLEHTFLLLPLVATPLALLLIPVLLEPVEPAGPTILQLARRAQPVAAAMLLASFFVSTGPLAAGLAAAWVIVTVLVALGGARPSLALRGDGHLANIGLFAAHAFLPIGAVWLLLSRLGFAPPRFEHLTVLLAAIHFHFSGFVLQVLIAATGLRLSRRSRVLTAVHRCAAIGAVAGIPVIAAGNIAHAPLVKFLGVSAMVVSTLGLAVTSTAVALKTSPGQPSRSLILVSAGSLAAAMLLAAVYGIGELTGRSLVDIPRMAAIHAPLNALGFGLCGLLGHLLVRPSDGAR